MIRTARLDDVATIAELERLSWPAGMGADAVTLAARIEAFAAGQLVFELDGTLVGYAAAQRITAEQLNAPELTFARITDRGRFTASHFPHGEIYQLIGVGVLPTERGSGVARSLIDRQIEQARQLSGIRRIVGFTRPARFARNSPVPIEAYVDLRGDQGELLDPVLAFHLNAGAKLVSIHPAFRVEDVEAGGYGVLIEYPV